MSTPTPGRRGLVAAVVVLALLLGASLLALLLHRGDGPRGGAAAPQVPAPAGTPSATSSPTASPVVAVPPPLTAPPAGVSWELFQGVALPVSRTDGPARVTGPVHAGFARTPTGALLADVQISYRSLVDPNLANLRRVAQAQLVDGPGKTAYLGLIDQLKDNKPPAAGFTQVVGFRYLAYSPDLAVISTATRGRSGTLQVGTDTVRWVAGDWRVELPPSGLQQPQAVQTLAGYVPWSGVSS